MVRAGFAAVVLSVSLGAAAIGAALPAGAAELPLRRPGLWEIKIKLTGGAAPTAMMRHCTNESTDRQMSTLFNPLAPPPCKQSTIEQQGETYTIESRCQADDRTVTVHSDVTGDFTNAYTVVTETKIQETPDSEPYLSNMTLEGKYAGSCLLGQKPGDVIMAGGMKINIKDIDNLRKLPKR